MGDKQGIGLKQASDFFHQLEGAGILPADLQRVQEDTELRAKVVAAIHSSSLEEEPNTPSDTKKVVTASLVEGDLNEPEKDIVFENSVVITGSLCAKSVFAKGHIKVHRNYVVRCNDYVSGRQEVGSFQTVGDSQTIGGDILVGESMCTGFSIFSAGKITCGREYGISAGVRAMLSEKARAIIKAREIQGTVLCGEVVLTS